MKDTRAGHSPAQIITEDNVESLNLTALENRIIIELLKCNSDDDIASLAGVTERLIEGRRNRILDILCGGLSYG